VSSCARSQTRSARLHARCGPFQRKLQRDLLALGQFTHLHLGLVERAAAGDLAALRVLLALDALLGDVALLVEARFFHGFTRRQLRLFRLLVAQRALDGEFRALRGAADLDLALLFEARVFGIAVDLQHLRWVSRFWLRMSTSVRCSISLRILRRVSIDSVSW